MSAQALSFDPGPNKTLAATLNVDGSNLSLLLTFRFNEVAQYWVLTIFSKTQNAIILDSIPLITAGYPAANILRQYSYLGIGSLYLLNMSGVDGEPNESNLGTDFVIIWSDTPIDFRAGV
jgi:hypothetical protein